MLTQLIRLATEDVIKETTSLTSIPGKPKGYTGFLPSEEYEIFKRQFNKDMKKIIGYELIDKKEKIEKDNFNYDIKSFDKGVSGKEILTKVDINEKIQIPIKVGDVVKMGRFKNKKVTIKSIDFNDKGDLLINGRPAFKFRIVKSKEIDEFLIHTDVGEVIKEVTATTGMGKGMVDDGPSAMMGGWVDILE